MSKKTYNLIESILGECDIKTKKGWITLSTYKKEYDILIDDTMCDDRFETDLTYGQEYERKFKDMVLSKGSKIEVKAERNGGPKNCDNTGNIFIEYESRGNPGGIAVTEANWWWHFLTMGEETIGGYFFTPKYLKMKARQYYKLGRTAPGGDDGTSRGVLIPTKDVF